MNSSDRTFYIVTTLQGLVMGKFMHYPNALFYVHSADGLECVHLPSGVVLHPDFPYPREVLNMPIRPNGHPCKGKRIYLGVMPTDSMVCAELSSRGHAAKLCDELGLVMKTSTAGKYKLGQTYVPFRR